MTYLEELVLGRLKAEGTHPQDDPDRIRAVLDGCANAEQCKQVAFDMRSRYQCFEYPEPQGDLFEGAA